jgi:rubrerythrin
MWGGEKPEIPKTVDERLLPSVSIKPSSSLADVLNQAMNAEKSAREFYASLAKRIKAPNRQMLMYLSKVENTHYLMLRSEYILALQFEDYAEKDIDKVIT